MPCGRIQKPRQKEKVREKKLLKLRGGGRVFQPGGVQCQEGRGTRSRGAGETLPLDAHSHIHSQPVSVSAQLPLMKVMADVDAVQPLNLCVSRPIMLCCYAKWVKLILLNQVGEGQRKAGCCICTHCLCRIYDGKVIICLWKIVTKLKEYFRLSKCIFKCI